MKAKITFYKEEKFKETLIGKVPEDWEVVKLREVLLLLRNGLTVRQSKEGRGYPITRIETISEEIIDSSKLGYVDPSDLKDRKISNYKMKSGDILFSHINSLEHIGKTAIYEGTPEFLLHGMNLLLLRPNKNKIYPRYLLYLLRLFRRKKIFWAMSKKAVNQASINQTELGRLKIILPPLEEQKTIAYVLSTVDEAIQKTNEIIEKIKRLKKGLMQELLTKGIGHKEFKNTEIGRIPKEWKVVKLNDIASIKGRIGWHGLKDEDYLAEGEYYLIRGIDFENGKVLWEKCVYVSKEWYERDPNIQLKEGDVLITKDGTIGKVALIEILPKKATLGTGIFRIRLRTNNCLSHYLYYIFKSFYFERFIKVLSAGSTLSHLYQRDLVNFKFPLPSLSEQQKIVEILSAADKRLEVERKRKEKLERVKKALMNLLLTGKIRVKVKENA